MKKLKHLFYLFIFTIYLFSCSPDNEDRVEDFQSQNLEYFVDLTEVQQIASNILFSTTDKSLKSKISLSEKKEIESIEEVKNELQEVVFYVINYKEGDSACDLDYVFNKSRKKDLSKIMVNTFGPNGAHTSMIVGRYRKN